MKKVISVILAIGLLIIQTAVYAAGYTMKVSAVTDPLEKLIMVNGEIGSGPDEQISVVVCNEQGEIVFDDEIMSGPQGAFKTNINTENLNDGAYTVTFRAENIDPAEFKFSLPLSSAQAVKLDARITGNDIFLIKNNAPDPDYSVIKLNVSNAQLIPGKLNPEDYEVTGLPEGYFLEGKVTGDNSVEFELKGNAAVTETCNVGIKLKSTIIKSGDANTSSDEIAGIILYPEDTAKKVNLDITEFDAYMTDSRNVDSNRSTFEVTVKIRSLAKEGLLVKGTDYDFTLPKELTGLKCELSANKDKNKIRIKFSGTLSSSLTKNAEISDFVIKPACVSGAEADSDPIKITFNKASQTSPGGGGPSGSGPSGGPGYTGGPSTSVDITPEVPPLEISFDDVKGHWAENEINTLAGDGIINGVGNNLFVPNRNISRAEFVTLTVKAFNITRGSYDGSFADVQSGDWYADAVGKALSAGIISKDTNFRPNDPITREEMVKVITGGWLINNERPQWVNMAQFNDKESISAWAADYVDIAVTLGLVKGDNYGNFNPKKSTTRAEAAAVIYRLLYLN